MGFSVHQPAVGAPLQFFPAMGSKELDDLIDAYVPGNASILDKRTVVTCEFVQHSIASGELFKFFMVHRLSEEGHDGAFESPASSHYQGSEYGLSYTAPVMTQSQWSHTPSRKSRSPAKKSQTDFSHLPGMKIMTKDGRDVTNSASRGSKTREQRDHAHMMRIIKACDSCKRKKIRCDPNHKRSATASTAKVSKKSRKAAISQPSSLSPSTPSFEAFDGGFDSSHDALAFNMEMDWDQFIQYDDQPAADIPEDYDFFLDPQGYFSPVTSKSSASASPAQPITPFASQALPITGIAEYDLAYPASGVTDLHVPALPYLDGADNGDYLDFNLYSPGSSSLLEEDLGDLKEVAATSPDRDVWSQPDAQNAAHERQKRRGRDVAQHGQAASSIMQSSSQLDEVFESSVDHNFCQLQSYSDLHVQAYEMERQTERHNGAQVCSRTVLLELGASRNTPTPLMERYVGDAEDARHMTARSSGQLYWEDTPVSQKSSAVMARTTTEGNNSFATVSPDRKTTIVSGANTPETTVAKISNHAALPTGLATADRSPMLTVGVSSPRGPHHPLIDLQVPTPCLTTAPPESTADVLDLRDVTSTQEAATKTTSFRCRVSTSYMSRATPQLKRHSLAVFVVREDNKDGLVSVVAAALGRQRSAQYAPSYTRDWNFGEQATTTPITNIRPSTFQTSKEPDACALSHVLMMVALYLVLATAICCRTLTRPAKFIQLKSSELNEPDLNNSATLTTGFLMENLPCKSSSPNFLDEQSPTGAYVLTVPLQFLSFLRRGRDATLDVAKDRTTKIVRMITQGHSSIRGLVLRRASVEAVLPRGRFAASVGSFLW
jgi:hypothetical protein